MRMWLDGVDYMPMSIGDRMRGWTIVRVLASRVQDVKPGTVGIGETGWTQYAAIDAAAFTTFAMPEGMPLPEMLGGVGFTGLTGYFGMLRVGRPKQGDVVVVSTAAGATGSIAAQVAKIQGAARVVGITGSNDKCAWLTDELKLDVALNYKAPDFKEQFAKATEGGINVYYDNGKLAGTWSTAARKAQSADAGMQWEARCSNWHSAAWPCTVASSSVGRSAATTRPTHEVSLYVAPIPSRPISSHTAPLTHHPELAQGLRIRP
jgi:NADPH-dependent curcumin reductase CurA